MNVGLRRQHDGGSQHDGQNGDGWQKDENERAGSVRYLGKQRTVSELPWSDQEKNQSGQEEKHEERKEWDSGDDQAQQQYHQHSAQALSGSEVEIVREVTMPHDQTSPWNRPVKDIGLDPSAQSPALEVRHLHFLVNVYFVSRLYNPAAEIDVFNTRPWVCFRIEASHSEKDVAANGAAAAPERHGTLFCLLVDKMVGEVFVLRKKVPFAGSWSYDPKVAAYSGWSLNV